MSTPAASTDKGKSRAEDAPSASAPSPSAPSPKATAIIVIGMAGSGKTTFMQRVNSYLHSNNQPPYVLNLDPAVTHLPFTANIDIRDTVDYQEVMKQYNLGPNGGILTALNLFTTKFDQVLGHVDKRADTVDHILVDTPGQIEIFTWSASGAIVTDALASALPTVVAYIIDTPRTISPTTFMSNMLYACSILYKTRLPFILVFNKTDVQPHEFALEWMRDFEAFQAALLERRNSGSEDGPGYMDSLMNSMSLVLDQFYQHLRAVGVSAMTGDGMPEFFDAVGEARQEYLKDYKPELDKIIAERAAVKDKEQNKSEAMAQLMADMTVSGGGKKSALDEMLAVGSDEESTDDDAEVIDKSSRTDYYHLPDKKTPRGQPIVESDEDDEGDGTAWPKQAELVRSVAPRRGANAARGAERSPWRSLSTTGRARNSRQQRERRAKLDNSTQAEWNAKLAQAQATTNKAAKHEIKKEYDQAFAAYVEAAQSYLYLVRNTADARLKEQLRAQSAKVLDRAQRIKEAKKELIRPVEVDRLSLESQDSAVQRGSTINNLTIPKWTAQDTIQKTIDQLEPAPAPALSESQQAEFGQWLPAAEAFKNAVIIDSSLSGREIVQDNVADCSLVTALIVASEHHKKFGSKLGFSCLYPQDTSGLPILNASGRHAVRLFVNGGWKRVAIDATLPVSRAGRPMCASTLGRKQLWPALVEKAYLTVKGGYSFSGSNSGDDLHALSGWIPEHVSLRGGAFRSDRSWARILDGLQSGKCVVTVGTGKSVAPELEKELVPSHSYAVMDVREQNGHRVLELVNPWPTSTRRQEASGTWTADLREALPEAGLAPIVVDWDVISAHFDAIHLNWDPARFSHSDVAHFTLSNTNSSPTAALSNTVQLKLKLDPPPSASQEVWLLLSRHQRDTSAEENEFIGLGVAVSLGAGSPSSTGPTRVDDDSTLSDGLHVLYRFEAQAGVDSYDLLVSHRGQATKLGFTLQAFGSTALKIVDGPKPLPYSASVKGAWTALTAGGNHTCPSFLHNPQYRLTLSPSTAGRAGQQVGEISIVCETSRELPVNVKLIRRRGERVDEFEERDIVAGSSKYAYGIDSCAARNVQPDAYTLVVSTFSPQQVGEFDLTVRSSLPIELSPVPAEGAGMYGRKARGFWLAGVDGGSADPLANPRFGLTLTKPTTLKIRLQVTGTTSAVPIAFSVYSTDSVGAVAEVVHSTGKYSDAVTGVVTPMFKLSPSEGGYAVIPSTFQPGVHVPFTLQLFADQPVEFALRM